MTRDEVLDAALEIIDEEGLEALSMRHLAKCLDTGSMRAYRHFPTKEDLIEALADREARRVRSIDLSGISEPRELLLEAACRTRDLLLEHPNLAPVVVSRPLSKATAAADLRLAGALLRSEGFADYQVGPVSAGLAAYTLGFVLYELGQRRFHQDSRDEMLAFYDELAEEVSGDDLLAAQVAGIRDAVDDDWGSLQFRTGLKAMIDGFWSQRAHVDTRRS